MNCPHPKSAARRASAALLGLFATAAPLLGQTYSIRELPPLSGDPYSVASGINEAGVIVGASGIAGSTAVAVRWIDGVPESLGTLPGFSSAMPFDVSNDGRVTGFSYVPNSDFPIGLGLPFVWQNGVMTELPLPGGRHFGETSQFRDSGDTIVGSAYDWDSINRFHNDAACRWDWDEPSGSWSVTALESLGGVGGYATNINSAGQIFGYAAVASGSLHACRWDPGISAPVDLGPIDDSAGCGGNDHGQSVGWLFGTAVQRAYIILPEAAYGLPGGLSLLGMVPGRTHSAGLYINNAGIVIGVGWNSGNFYAALNSTTRGFIWRNGQLRAASTVIPAGLQWTVKLLWDINQQGRIVGQGVRGGQLRGVVLSECTGDLNGDFLVNLADLAALLAHFGVVAEPTLADGDLDFDGDVDLGDLATLLANFGTSCL